MKKVLSMLLCVVMLLSTVSLLASCSKGNNEPKISGEAAVDITGYGIIYGADLSSSGKQQVSDLANEIKAVTKLALRAQQDAGTEEIESADPEILIGNTGRPETQKALKGVKGHGWVIRVIDNKIVIAGTNAFLTRVAMAYFSNNYLTADAVSGTTLALNKKVLMSKMETFSLVDEEGAGKYAVVYDDSVDDETNSDYGGDANPTKGGMETDYIYDLATSVRSLLASSTGAKTSTFLNKVASVEATSEEVLVGNMKRDEYRAELNKLAADEYALSVVDGKIMLLGWNDVMLASAYSLFEDMMKSSTVTNEDETKTLELPANFSIKLKATSVAWETDFPKPEGEGIELDGTVDVSDNSIEYIYSGSGVNRESYVAYCTQLEAAGYKLYTPENQIEGSSFRQYLNEDNGVTLYVYHAAYTHAEDQNVTDTLNSIRIIASNTQSVILPGNDLLESGEHYTRKTDPKITSLKMDYDVGSFGLSYIITLEDGSFIMFDGGQGGGWDDAEQLWYVFEQLYIDAWGEAPGTNGRKLHIRAWVLTHEHSDHYAVFKSFISKKANLVQCDYLLANFTSQTEQYNSHNPSNSVQADLATLQQKAGFKYLKVHTGQVFYMANVKMEVLHTHEDTYPKKLEYFNNSSTVVRTTINTTNDGGVVENTETCIWLGDLERIGGRRLRAMYGSTLDADMVQVAHHGVNGVDEKVYDLISPEIVWFPAASSRYYDKEKGKPGLCTNPNNSIWYGKVDYHLCQEIPTVKIILMGDVYNVTMEFTADGPQYAEGQLYDVTKGGFETITQHDNCDTIIEKNRS